MSRRRPTRGRSKRSTNDISKAVLNTLNSVVEEEELNYAQHRMDMNDMRAELRELRDWKDRTTSDLGRWTAMRSKQERNLDKTRKRQAKRTARLNTWQKDLQARADLEEQMVTMVQVQESLVEEATNASHYVQHMEGRLEKQKHKSSTIEAIMSATEENLADLVWQLWIVTRAERPSKPSPTASPGRRGGQGAGGGGGWGGGGGGGGEYDDDMEEVKMDPETVLMEAFKDRLRKFALEHDPTTALQMLGDDTVKGVKTLIQDLQDQAAAAAGSKLSLSDDVEALDAALAKTKNEVDALQEELFEEQKRSRELSAQIEAINAGSMGEMKRKLEHTELAYKQIWRMLQEFVQYSHSEFKKAVGFVPPQLAQMASIYKEIPKDPFVAFTSEEPELPQTIPT